MRLSACSDPGFVVLQPSFGLGKQEIGNSHEHTYFSGHRSSERHHLVGLLVKASASRGEDPGFESRLRRDFSEVESYQ